MLVFVEVVVEGEMLVHLFQIHLMDLLPLDMFRMKLWCLLIFGEVFLLVV